jgi:hypothetical protein
MHVPGASPVIAAIEEQFAQTHFIYLKFSG